MSSWLVILAALVAVYCAFLVALLLLGRRTDARAIAGFIPDCSRLLTRLMRDPVTPRRRRWLLVLVIGYLAMPLDLVPDFIPVIGYLDDAIVLALTLRWLLRNVGSETIMQHWSGPEASLRVVLRLAGEPR